MKFIIITFITLSLIIIFFCRLDQPLKRDTRKPGTGEQVIDIDNYDSLLVYLARYENEMVEHPDSSQLIKQLLSISYNRESGYLYVTGIGVTSKEFSSNEIRLIELQQEARNSAKEWALYIKALLTDKKVTSRTKIFGKVMYWTNIMEVVKEDTVYQLYKMPASSIVVR